MESYRRIRSEERATILVLVQNGKNQADRAKALGRNQSSLSRELARGLEKGAYNPFFVAILSEALTGAKEKELSTLLTIINSHSELSYYYEYCYPSLKDITQKCIHTCLTSLCSG